MHRLAHARSLISQATGLGANHVAVALSGGKDSLAVLDLCVKALGPDRVSAFAMYFVPGLRTFETPVKAAAARYGIQLHLVPHWDLTRIYKHGALRPHTFRTSKMPDTVLPDIEELVRSRSGCDWVAYGHRADESLERRGMLKQTQGVDTKRRRFYPLWKWRAMDVYDYLATMRIPLPPQYGKDRMQGVGFEPEFLMWACSHAPDDYEKICRTFPMAEAQLKRWEMFPETRPQPKARKRKHAEHRDSEQGSG